MNYKGVEYVKRKNRKQKCRNQNKLTRYLENCFAVVEMEHNNLFKEFEGKLK